MAGTSPDSRCVTPSGSKPIPPTGLELGSSAMSCRGERVFVVSRGDELAALPHNLFRIPTVAGKISGALSEGRGRLGWVRSYQEVLSSPAVRNVLLLGVLVRI